MAPQPARVANVSAVSAVSAPTQRSLFVVASPLKQEQRAMLTKMIQALKWTEGQEVAVINESDHLWSEVPCWNESRCLLVFSEKGPGGWGQLKHWEGHKLMQTHSLDTLLKQPELKRETWKHLQEFAEVVL